MPLEAALLSAEGLVRSFGAERALAGVDLVLGPGQVLAVGGPNGAGKSTLLRVLAGLVRPTRGTVRLGPDGGSPRDPATRRRVGLLSHQSFLYEDLTLHESLVFTARLYRLADPHVRAAEALATAGLSARADRPVRELSRGMLQRAAIARALLHDPTVLLLDEPFTGLDEASAERLRGLLEAQRALGRAVLVVTHHLAEVWDAATHVGVLVAGRWARLGPRPSAPAEVSLRG